MVLFQFFVLDVMYNFRRLSEDDMFTQLERIAAMADEGEENAESVGLLTTDNRTSWAQTRQLLMEGTIYGRRHAKRDLRTLQIM